MQQSDLFDLRQSRRLRDEGMARTEVDAQVWQATARFAFEAFRASGVKYFITEDFRAWWMNHRGYMEPRSPHCWGALTGALLKAGRIQQTGRVRAAAAVKSHARKMLEWEIL